MLDLANFSPPFPVIGLSSATLADPQLTGNNVTGSASEVSVSTDDNADEIDLDDISASWWIESLRYFDETAEVPSAAPPSILRALNTGSVIGDFDMILIDISPPCACSRSHNLQFNKGKWGQTLQ